MMKPPTVAEIVRRERERRALSQSELAELARVSTKTIQRMETGANVAGSSRRAVFEALGIDLDAAREVDHDEAPALPETPWTRISDARTLLQKLVAARAVDVEVDRDGWQRGWRRRGWFQAGIIIASKDPADEILDIVEEISGPGGPPPDATAKQRDRLAKAVRGAGKLNWSLAFQVDRSGLLSLYLSSPAGVRERVGRPA